MRRPTRGVMIGVLALVVAACGTDGNGGGGAGAEAGAGTRITVVAGFYPIAEATARVGGDRVRVVNLTPAGSEPHDLELTPRQVDQIEDAGLALYLGEGFQPAVEKVAERRTGPSLDLLADMSLDTGGDSGGKDPHFWLDPTLLAGAVDRIEAALVAVDGTAAGVFAANAKAYRSELATLDGEFRAGLSGCRRNQVVTAHAAFHYLARRYGLTQQSIAGLSPESEPDPERLADLTRLIEAEGVTTVFYESLVSPDVAETLAREAGVATAVLDPLEGLSATDVKAQLDYAGVMRRNLGALRRALGCGGA